VIGFYGAKGILFALSARNKAMSRGGHRGMRQRWEFTWKAVGYGENRDEALADAKSFLNEAEPSEEVLLEEGDEE
jgi:hypothetical protein